MHVMVLVLAIIYHCHSMPVVARYPMVAQMYLMGQRLEKVTTILSGSMPQ